MDSSKRHFAYTMPGHTEPPNPETLHKSILVVEDERDRWELFRYYLEPDFKITFAANAADALGVMSRGTFQLAIIDWRLPIDEKADPESTGGQRVVDALPSNVGLFITFSLDTPDSIRAKVKGKVRTEDCFAKPVLWSDLSRRVHEFLQTSAQPAAI